MCEYCKQGESESIGSELDMQIEGNRLVLNYAAYSIDSSFDEEIEIKYCMFCGKELLA